MPRDLFTTPSQGPTYSRVLADSAVNDFVKKYARVNKFVAKRLAVTDDQWIEMLIKQFRYHNARWNVTRDILKRIEKHDLYDILAWQSDTVFLKYLTNERLLVTDR